MRLGRVAEAEAEGQGWWMRVCWEGELSEWWREIVKGCWRARGECGKLTSGTHGTEETRNKREEKKKKEWFIQKCAKITTDTVPHPSSCTSYSYLVSPLCPRSPSPPSPYPTALHPYSYSCHRSPLYLDAQISLYSHLTPSPCQPIFSNTWPAASVPSQAPAHTDLSSAYDGPGEYHNNSY